MTVSKRDLLLAAAGAMLAAGPVSRTAKAADRPADAGRNMGQDMGHDMTAFPPSWMGSEKIAFLVYPQFTALDLVGAHHMLASLLGATTYIVGKTRDTIVSDMKLAFQPSNTFDDCPKDLDIICVPGGADGTLAAMQDDATINFLADRGLRAKFVTSVCTGSLLLGAAGLLKGYKATSHWAARDVLKAFGAEPVNQRVVIDRNRITGGGVTAGLDFGLTLVAKLRDADYAKSVQLLAEYQPAPPFSAGTPETAGPEITKMMAEMFTSFVDRARSIAETTTRRL